MLRFLKAAWVALSILNPITLLGGAIFVLIVGPRDRPARPVLVALQGKLTDQRQEPMVLLSDLSKPSV